MSSTRPTDSITDFSQFNALRRGARENDDATVRKAAQQFEALFTQQMLKSARAASPGNDVMGGGQTEFYQDIFDQQMAVHLSSGKGLGLADLLVRQLRGTAAAEASATAATNAALPLGAIGTPPSLRLSPTPVDSGHGLKAGGAAAASTAAGAGGDQRTAFVQKILPHAERAARELGVPARVLIAQAALETSWGQHAIRKGDGDPSLNYFGIKADRRWQGAEVRTTTTEYVGGSARRERADFRAYDSAAASFDDYVNFLKSNPRYADALNHGGSATHFVQGLQKAGYASDPAYAQKILRIADGPTLQLALAGRPRTVTA
ncbi:flagellar assembly peptidoglycan hydrolase FlgJ [Solimonas soli]|uniref:flagellar assembly peptidoglycan hydrolase FlgJ n=1 Tax=Solimonas soli TaxID=413479 RepID=UPI00047F8687|nr:flagellar assembly peptidoglycan hydrolase FlgJ [Solimonas soli]